MKRSIMGVLSLAVCVSFSGCKSAPPVASDHSVFGYMQEQSAKLIEDGQLAAMGIGKSRQIDIAVARAKLDARVKLAQSISTKIENLQEAFVEEIGEAESSEINQLFSSATKQITSQVLEGTVPVIEKYDEGVNGVQIAYVLMVQDPTIVDSLLKNNDASKHLYERFRASKAFERLDKEIQEYEAAEQAGFIDSI